MLIARMSASAIDAVSDDRARDARHQARCHRIVGAHDRDAVERHVVQEVDEALLEPLEVAVVRGEMIVVDVGDDRHHRMQMHERRVALVGLGDQVIAGAEPRVAAGALRAGRR